MLGARLLIERGRPLEALSLIDQVRLVRREDSDLLLAAEALSRIQSKEQLAVKEAQILIERLFRPEVGPLIALKAFSILGRIPPAERELALFAEATARLRAEKSHGTVGAEASLLAAEIEMTLAPDRRGEILADTVARWMETAPDVLGEWLLTIGEPGLVLEPPTIPLSGLPIFSPSGSGPTSSRTRGRQLSSLIKGGVPHDQSRHHPLVCVPIWPPARETSLRRANSGTAPCIRPNWQIPGNHTCNSPASRLSGVTRG